MRKLYAFLQICNIQKLQTFLTIFSIFFLAFCLISKFKAQIVKINWCDDWVMLLGIDMQEQSLRNIKIVINTLKTVLDRQYIMARTIKKIQLPKDYAQNLLELEIQYKLAHKPTAINIKNLIEMYTLGVEYYESIRSHKFLYFQLKMTEIFTNSNTMNSISEETQTVKQTDSPLKKKMRSLREQDKIQALQIKQKQQKMLQQMASNASEMATVTTIRKLLSENDIKNKTVNQKVNQQLTSQDVKLKQKLQRRKSRLMLSKSFCSAGVMGQNDTKDTLFSDGSGNLNIGQPLTKPLQANFHSVIKENESDEEAQSKNKKDDLGLIKVMEINNSQQETL